MSRFKNITEIDEDKLRHPLRSAPESIRPEVEPCVEYRPPPLLSGEALEAFIGMRDAIWKMTSERPLRIIAVSSSTELEGKTRVAVGLALTLAMDLRKRVLLVDGNLRVPAVASTFGLSPTPGLTDLVLRDVPFQEVLQTTENSSLKILTSGVTNLTPAEIYSFPRLNRRMAEFREAFDLTIVDTPGVKKHPDFEILSRHLDGTVLVLEADKSQLTLIQEVKKRIEAARVPILGVAINRSKSPIPPFLNRRFGLD